MINTSERAAGNLRRTDRTRYCLRCLWPWTGTLLSRHRQSNHWPLNESTWQYGLSFKPPSKTLVDGDLHSVMEQWMSHGPVRSSLQLSEWRSLHLFERFIFSLMAVWLTWAMRDMCSGSNIELRADQNIWCLKNPSFHWPEIGTTAQPRRVAVMWCGCHC